MCDIKKELKERARVLRVMSNALGYDTEYVFTDIKNFDLICLDESLRETKDTLQKLTDNIKEIEYLLYLMEESKPTR